MNLYSTIQLNFHKIIINLKVGTEEDRIILTEHKKTTVNDLKQANKLDFS